MNTSSKWLDETLYRGVGDNTDDELFRQRILAVLQPQHVVLDPGVGAGIIKQMNFKGMAKRVCGIDLDERVVGNPLLDEGRISDAGAIPYDATTFDLVFSDNVLEHLSESEAVFGEVARVLKPGGILLFKTPKNGITFRRSPA